MNNDTVGKATMTTVAPRPWLVLTLFGRCGAFFVHSLFDGHPQLCSIPGVAANHVMNEAIQLSHLMERSSNKELALFLARRFASYYNDDHYRKYLGLDRLGENADETLSIDIATFHRNVFFALKTHAEKPVLLRMFEAMHDAFSQTLSEPVKPRVFFHAHAASFALVDQTLRLLPDHQVLFLLREPVDNVESSVNVIHEGAGETRRLPWLYSVLREMLTIQANATGTLDEKTLAIRLEDIKAEPEKMLRAICAAVDLPFDDALLQSTFLGRKYHTAPTNRNPGMQGFKPTSSTPAGYRLSRGDRAFFATLFRNTSLRAGYPLQETAYVETMQAILDGKLLDVEIELAQRDGIAAEDLSNDADLAGFRHFLTTLPDILAGPPALYSSRFIFPGAIST